MRMSVVIFMASARPQKRYFIQAGRARITGMTKWLLTLLFGLFLLGLLTPLLKRAGIGRLPGDIRFRHRGHAYYFPFTSSVLLSIFLSILLSLFK